MTEFLVSECDRPLLTAYSWWLNDKGYVVRSWTENGRTKNERLHRRIMRPNVGEEIDHINGCRADNRRENLRLCSSAENKRNRSVHKNNASGFPNVYFEPPRGHRSKGSFTAQVRVNGKKVRRSGFETAEAAYQVAQTLLLSLHGEFSKTFRNQPK